MNTIQLYINGEWRNSGNGATTPVINPASEAVLSHLASANEDDLILAAKAAETAFPLWRDLGPLMRSDILRKAASYLREHASEIGSDISLENGKTVSEGIAETNWSAEFLDWCAEEGRRLYGRVIPARLAHVRQTSLREPVGPVLALSPWNWPLVTAVKKISAALAAGCSVVLKPAEETPSGPIHLVKAFEYAGMPKGVFNVVFGSPAFISETLINRPEIRKVSFTGSVPVGVHLSELAARAKKPITLELGGHAPVIVFEDADIDKAVERVFPFKFRTAGQVCSSPTRMIVHESLADRFAEAFAAKTRAIKVGPGNDEQTEMGPLISAKRLKAISELVDDAVAKGAEVLCGGERLGDDGYFYLPTVLNNVSPDAKIMTTEPFGPLAPISRFSTYEEAIALANATEFGLAGYIFTTSLVTAHKAERDLDCGVIGVNSLAVSTVEAPFGGFKSSGSGKEGGIEGFDAYLKTKFIVEDIA
jgi:succinate-semialdehyde dehydrogenase/glutarate-semialdehyde dehydrogenase